MYLGVYIRSVSAHQVLTSSLGVRMLKCAHTKTFPLILKIVRARGKRAVARVMHVNAETWAPTILFFQQVVMCTAQAPCGLRVKPSS